MLDAIFIQYLEALGPYLDQLVIAGGWVPHLYAQYYGQPIPSRALYTVELDTGIPSNSFVDKDPSLDKTILEAGFSHQFASLENPPVVKYVQTNSAQQYLEIEFITDNKSGKSGVVQLGSVNAEPLYSVELLFDSPWSINLLDLGHSKNLTFRVPRPGSYILHKLLVAPRRRGVQKTAKDLYSVFFVLDSFLDWDSEIAEVLAEYQISQKKMVQQASDYLSEGFQALDSFGMNLIVSQRLQDAYPQMSEDQFRQHVLHTMKKLLGYLGCSVDRAT